MNLLISLQSIQEPNDIKNWIKHARNYVQRKYFYSILKGLNSSIKKANEIFLKSMFKSGKKKELIGKIDNITNFLTHYFQEQKYGSCKETMKTIQELLDHTIAIGNLENNNTQEDKKLDIKKRALDARIRYDLEYGSKIDEIIEVIGELKVLIGVV